MNNKPNILFFFTDDQRYDTIAALGNEEINTPNLDSLVQKGTSFTRAHIPGGTHGAVCMPSRAMLHTGRTLFHLENSGRQIPGEHKMLGEVLQKAGYQTFGTGKWHNGTKSYARSFNNGAEIMFGGMGDHWNVKACDYDPTGEYRGSKIINEPYRDNTVTRRLCDHIKCGKHSSELFCEASTEWLKKYDSQDPFFMYISFMAPHDPRSMPENFLNMYNPDKISLPDNFQDEHFDFGVKNIRDEVLADYPRDKKEVKKHISEYYAMISHLDYELGKVIEVLKQKGEYENTIIIFAGDNGLAVGRHGLMGKQNNYEHSIRVPLIFSGPGIPENEKRDNYVYLYDIFPTICEMIGLEIPDSVEGKSLTQVIKNKDKETRDYLYFAYESKVRAIKGDRYKLIVYNTEEGTKKQLFDLANDPQEMNNLYGKIDYKEVEEKLKEIMIKYKKQWDDEEHPTGEKFWSEVQL
ncbi:MAG: sulfatase-like hydrolase/transferase [Bacillota bacterium]